MELLVIMGKQPAVVIVARLAMPEAIMVTTDLV